MGSVLVERSTGDVIPASDHNDVKDYVEDGTTNINALSLSIQGVGEVISTDAYITPIRIINPDATGTLFYSSDGNTLIAKLDDSGNWYILGRQISL